ncbi:cobinamide kinase and guanylyltransferase [Escherichia coli MS 79-10]|nr:cobinamide kinase and guanylyltransferase [Escherichia coli MS 79-10]
MQSSWPDKTRQASHPASAPCHWRMRRERLIRPTCAIPQAG